MTWRRVLSWALALTVVYGISIFTEEAQRAVSSDPPVSFSTTNSDHALTLTTPRTLTVETAVGNIVISLVDGAVTLPEGLSSEQAAVAFWRALRRMSPDMCREVQGGE